MSTTESILTLTTIETESKASTTTLSAAHRSGAQSSVTRACFGDSTRCVWLEHLQLELEMGCPGPGGQPVLTQRHGYLARGLRHHPHQAMQCPLPG